MSFLRKLLGGNEQPSHQPWDAQWDQRPSWMQDGMPVQLCDGREDLEVVGEASYQDSLWRLVGGRTAPDDRVRVGVVAVLVAEADNPYDPYAVSLWVGGLKVGYLSRGDAERYRPGLLALQRTHGRPVALAGVIAGGGMREDGPGRLGVFLRHDPADFGLPAAAPFARREPRLRTGLTDALATDEADAAYDLGWIGRLPEDDSRAITKLRQLLARERDPIDRHFMHAELEARLYRCREAFVSALDEYDLACRQHDSEMAGIREAFMTKWEQVPVLETYRQMAIRQQKAKDYEQALWWAERGIAIYGDDAARPEAVADLQKRAETYRAKLQPKPRPAGRRTP